MEILEKQLPLNLDAVTIFTKVSTRYQYQLRRKLAIELKERLKDYLNEEDLNNLLRRMNLQFGNKKNNGKKTSLSNNDHEDGKCIDTTRVENCTKTNLLKFVIRELKENMAKSTPLYQRNKIAQKVINLMNNGESFQSAKSYIYEKNNICVTYQVGFDNDRTHFENMDIEREYDECSGKIIYGWDDFGEVLYEPTFGACISPPTFKDGGEIWREVLDNRWEQRSYYEDDDVIDNFKG